MLRNIVLALSWIDYLLFGATLTLSALIGIYFGCFGNRQSTIKDYLLGGKKMRIIPIAVSVAVTNFSGTSLLAIPAEIYRYGGAIWWAVLCFIILGVLGVYVYMPVFFRLQLTSIYEYLEKRFDKRTRTMAFSFYILGEILAIPVYAYTPALAFGTASGFNLTLTGFILCVICVVYTTLGGLKTVVWTDLFQFVIIIISVVTVYVIGLNSAGGFLSVWNTALEGERLDIFNFDFDITARDNFWVYFLGVTTALCASIFVHQTGVQKFLALPTYSDCVWSVIYLVISLCIVYPFCILIGLVCYSKYKDCDPLSAKIIKKHDQLLPFYVSDIAASIPGITGLLIAGICCASLSTMSSDLNALSAVIYKEYTRLFLKRELSEKSPSKVPKLITLVLGLLCACCVFALDRLGEVIAIGVLLNALTKGPLLGLFTLGLIFPNANTTGAFYGTIISFILQFCLIVSSRVYSSRNPANYQAKPLSTSGCDFLNQTVNWMNVTTMNTTSQLSSNLTTSTSKPHWIFRISFFLYPFLGMIFTVILGIIISYVTKGNSVVDESLLSPVNLSRWFKKPRSDNRASYSSVTQTVDNVTEANK